MALNLGELNAIITADDRSFNRTINRVHDKMDKTGKKMGSLSGFLGALGKATAFASLATGAAGLASALGPAISLVGVLGVAVVGLGAAVPAFAASGAAVIGTLTLAFQGLGDAIAGDEEALERLPGPAKEFVKVLGDLKDDWEDLQKSVQSKFFEGLSDTFNETARKVLPILKNGLTGVADGLSDMAASALDAMDSTEFLTGMKAVLKSTENGLKTAAEGMGGFVRGFGILMSAFAPLIERAGLAVANLGQAFGDWMAEAEATGRLNALIESMLNTLSTLGAIVQNIGSIFVSVFSSANTEGGGLLGTVESLTGKLSEFFASAEGQDTLNSFFSSLRDVADAVAPIVTELARVFGEDLAPHFATIAEEVGPSLKNLISELGDAIGEIDVKTLADGFASVLDSVSPLIEPLGNFIGKVSEIDGLVPAIVIALGLWTVAQWALNAAMYANPIVWIIALIIALIAAIVLIIVNWDTVVAAIKDRWELMKDIWSAGKDFITSIWQAIGDFISDQVDMTVDAIHRFAAIPGQVAAWLVDMKNRAVAKFQEFLSAANAKIDAVLSAIQRMGGIPGKIAGFIQSAKDKAIEKFNSLVSWVKGVPGKIMDALGNLGSLLKNAGRDIIDGLLDGIQDGFGAVQDKLGELTNMLPDWKGPPEKDKTILGPAGEMVIGGFVDGLERAIPTVQRALAGLTTDIGLQVDGSAGSLRVEATTSLSEEDRALLRELAEARNQFHVSTDANTRVQEIKRDAMVVP